MGSRMGMGQGVRIGAGHDGIICVLQTKFLFLNSVRDSVQNLLQHCS